jgi:hypothetical protein
MTRDLSHELPSLLSRFGLFMRLMIAKKLEFHIHFEYSSAIDEKHAKQ